MYTLEQLENIPERLSLKEVVAQVNELLRKSAELKDSGDISIRTVHYYVQADLLPKRQGRGPGKTYPTSFVYRLLFIKLLQKRDMSLDGIREKYLHSAMGQVSDDMIKSVLLGEEPLDIGYAEDFRPGEISSRLRQGEELIPLYPRAMSVPASRILPAKSASYEWKPTEKKAIVASLDECEFCSIDTSRIAREAELCIAIHDAFPVSRGHILILPRRHIRSIFKTTEEERAAIFAMLELVCADLNATYEPDGFNIGINEGRAAGQTLMHMHLHVIPRYAGDKPDPRGGIRWLFPDKAAYWEG